MNAYPITSASFDEAGKGYTEFRKVGTNPDRFEKLKKYNTAKNIVSGLFWFGITLTAGSLLFKILNNKK